jgi:hypothetical protein
MKEGGKMLKFFLAGGPLMVILLILAIAIVIMSMKKGIDLLTGKDPNRARLESGLNAILFWGAISGILGFLAHFMALYKIIGIVTRAEVISPNLVAIGFGESLVSILFGLWIFTFSAVIWFFLRWRYGKRFKT